MTAPSSKSLNPVRVLSGPGSGFRVAFALLWVVFVGGITLTDAGAAGGRDLGMQFCIRCGIRGTGDGILNTVLFFPLGMLLGTRWRPWIALLSGLALSTAIEFAQLSIDGRYSNLGDIVSNGTGALLGALLVQRLRIWMAPGAALRTATLVSVGFPLVYLALAGVMLQPVGTDRRYFAQWTATLGSMPVYEGEVLAATLNGVPIPQGGPYPPETDPREALSNDWIIRTVLIAGGPPRAVSPIVSIHDARRREIALLGAHGFDLVWRERTLGRAWRLDRPDLRWRGALADVQVGEEIVVGVRREGRDRCLQLDEETRCGLGITPGDTWGFLLFLEGASVRARTILAFAWMATLFLLLGLVGGPRRSVLAAAGTSAVVILAIVASSGLLLPPPIEWLGMGTGVASGFVLRPVVRAFLGKPA